MKEQQWLTVKSEWSQWNGNTECELENEEENLKTTHSIATISNDEPGIHKLINLNNISRLQKLLRITAYVNRFVRNCRIAKELRETYTLKTEEIHNAIIIWITNTQVKSFYDKFTDESKQWSIVRQLKIYKADDKTFRSGGRLGNALVCETAKYPYLLPTKDRFTTLVIQEAHERQIHAGVNITVTFLRQTFWIQCIRQFVRSVLKKCVICRKVTGKPFQKPEPPPLPKERVQEDVPFSISGVDFARSLHIMNTDNTTAKVYICL